MCYSKYFIRPFRLYSSIFFIGLTTLPGTHINDARAKDDYSTDIKQAQVLSSVLENTAGSILPSVVQIKILRDNSSSTDKQADNPLALIQSQQIGLGTGIIIDFSPSEKTAVVLTTCSVVQGESTVMVSTADGRNYRSTNVKEDRDTDIAIIRIEGIDNAKAAEFADSDDLKIGQLILTVGNPAGFTGSVSMGIISAKGRQLDFALRTLFIQTDAAANPGSAGGPIVNLEGKVIGIVSSIYNPGKWFDGIAFAVPINHSRYIAQQLLQHGRVPRGQLGVEIQEITPELQAKLKIPGTSGARVLNVFKDSTAAEAGIMIGDIIVKISDKKISNPIDLVMAIDRLPLGVKHEIKLIRDGEEISVFVVLKEKS
jgi:S1-C subfamily serine protease